MTGVERERERQRQREDALVVCLDRGWLRGRQHPEHPSLLSPFFFCSHHQDWGDELFGALKAAGGKVYSNYAVG